MFKIKFPTKRIFRIFPILRINGMAQFCNLFMERPSYICIEHNVDAKPAKSEAQDVALVLITRVNSKKTNLCRNLNAK